MPVVFATDAPTASGHSYNDVLGKQYEFPLRYQNLVTEGDPFVYYRGTRGRAAGQAGYFGVGITGEIRASPTPSKLIVEVHDVDLFPTSVPIRAADGTYLESASTRPTNWQNGVRRISNDVLARILELAPADLLPDVPPLARRRRFASSEHASALERYSVKVALELLEAEFGRSIVREMPPGNPGYDISVERSGSVLHVEVKGTVLADPVFHLSEGQRRHAAALGADFRLIVVYDVSAVRGTHKVVVLDGPLDAGKVDLQPEAWTGRALL